MVSPVRHRRGGPKAPPPPSGSQIGRASERSRWSGVEVLDANLLLHGMRSCRGTDRRSSRTTGGPIEARTFVLSSTVAEGTVLQSRPTELASAKKTAGDAIFLRQAQQNCAWCAAPNGAPPACLVRGVKVAGQPAVRLEPQILPLPVKRFDRQLVSPPSIWTAPASNSASR